MNFLPAGKQFISVDRHSILDNVGWLVGWLVGWSHYEDDLSNHENMHENAVIHDDTSNHDDRYLTQIIKNNKEK